MKTFKLLVFMLVLSVGIITVLSSFKAPVSNDPKLTITNKTDSDIDEIYIDDSGDILGDFEILHPGEEVTVAFDCEGVAVDFESVIKLVFEDKSSFSFNDNVCDGDFDWDITQDGKD